MKSGVAFFAAVLALAAFVGCGTKPAEQAEAPKTVETVKTRPSAPPPEDPAWSYEPAAVGPSAWGKLSGKWSACGAGRSQSPIDIEKTKQSALPALRTTFRPAELKIVHHEHMADIVNTGHTVQVNYTEGDKLKIGEEEFELLQYHFHSPSEHTVGGKRFAMEMHLVHRSADSRFAVVGVLIEEGAENPAFEPIWANLPNSKGVENHLEHVQVDVNQLLPQMTASYRYTGSLTTPPCSESIQWILMQTPVQLSKQQIDAFRSVLSGNNRPVQPLNGRTVATDRVRESVTR